MSGYIMHNGVCIRVIAGLTAYHADVPMGTAPHLHYVRFDSLADAKAFIDAGRPADGHTLNNM